MVQRPPMDATEGWARISNVTVSEHGAWAFVFLVLLERQTEHRGIGTTEEILKEKTPFLILVRNSPEIQTAVS